MIRRKNEKYGKIDVGLWLSGPCLPPLLFL